MNVLWGGPPDHAPVLAAVLGYVPLAEAATVENAGGVVAGLLLRDVTAADLARLDFHAAAVGRPPRDLPGLADGAPLTRVYPAASAGQGADLLLATATDIMALFGHQPPQAIHKRLTMMEVRAASRLRAAQTAPVTRRYDARPADVAVLAWRQPYAHFFAIEEYDLRHRRFDGTMGPQITRAAFVSGDAVTVLPYDPARDRVLLIEQFRAAPLARGDAQPWSFEAIAGRIDAGETPEQAGRREAVEEAGLVLDALLPVAGYYPSPGAVSEYLYSYVALTDLPDGAAGVFGLAEEAEDIRGHLIGFADAMAMVASGEINNAPLLLSLMWLQRERQGLRG